MSKSKIDIIAYVSGGCRSPKPDNNNALAQLNIQIPEEPWM